MISCPFIEKNKRCVRQFDRKFLRIQLISELRLGCHSLESKSYRCFDGLMLQTYDALCFLIYISNCRWKIFRFSVLFWCFLYTACNSLTWELAQWWQIKQICLKFILCSFVQTAIRLLVRLFRSAFLLIRSFLLRSFVRPSVIRSFFSYFFYQCDNSYIIVGSRLSSKINF